MYGNDDLGRVYKNFISLGGAGVLVLERGHVRLGEKMHYFFLILDLDHRNWLWFAKIIYFMIPRAGILCQGLAIV